MPTGAAGGGRRPPTGLVGGGGGSPTGAVGGGRGSPTGAVGRGRGSSRGGSADIEVGWINIEDDNASDQNVKNSRIYVMVLII